MAAKKIEQLIRQSARGGSALTLLQGGTYDPATGWIEPGQADWLDSLTYDSRDITYELSLEDGTRTTIVPRSCALKGTSVAVHSVVGQEARPDRGGQRYERADRVDVDRYERGDRAAPARYERA